MKKRILLAVLMTLSAVLVAPVSTQQFPQEAYYCGFDC